MFTLRQALTRLALLGLISLIYFVNFGKPTFSGAFMDSERSPADSSTGVDAEHSLFSELAHQPQAP
jgi:hypothetical protein